MQSFRIYHKVLKVVFLICHPSIIAHQVTTLHTRLADGLLVMSDL